MNRLYSFVLPAYKAHFLKEAIDSILAQTYTNFELIIVNDASPDDLDSIISIYDDSRIQYYVNAQNLGGKDLIAHWNNTITIAKGEYLILASDDDIYHHKYLEKMNQLVDRYPQVNLLRPRKQNIDSSGNIIDVNGWLPELCSPLEFAYFKSIAGKGLQFYMFKKEPLLANGGFVNYPMAWYSDDATVVQMADKGVAFCDEILFSFRFSGENISSKLNDTKLLMAKIRATVDFYADLPLLIGSLDKWKEEDKWFQDTIISSIPGLLKKELRFWFGESDRKACVRCISMLEKTGRFTKLELTKMLLRKLLVG